MLSDMSLLDCDLPIVCVSLNILGHCADNCIHVDMVVNIQILKSGIGDNEVIEADSGSCQAVFDHAQICFIECMY